MFFDVVDFQKCAGAYEFGPAGVTVDWFRCARCDFLFTPFFDDWTHQDFARFVYNRDYAQVDPDYGEVRPREMARHAAGLLAGHENARILDYGAGLGLFAKGLASHGFRHVESYDPFSIPRRPAGHFDIITCNEVIEHTPSPLAALEDMRALLGPDGCLLLGECLQPPDIGEIRCNWWYVAPRNGHASTFSDRTFAVIATRLGMMFHRGPDTQHALSLRPDGPFAALADRCGPSLMSARLCAPDHAEAAGWGGLEDAPPRQFRWTLSNAVTWRVEIPLWRPACFQARIPIAHESRPDFLAGCRIEINGQPIATIVRDRQILAEADGVPCGPAEITLRTPDLTRTSDRAIGIAILTA